MNHKKYLKELKKNNFIYEQSGILFMNKTTD